MFVSKYRNETLDELFEVERNQKYGEIYQLECHLKTLNTCLGYLDDNSNDIQTPILLKIKGATKENWKLGKNGLSGRVYLYDKRENDFNEQESLKDNCIQSFSNLSERLEIYLYQ